MKRLLKVHRILLVSILIVILVFCLYIILDYDEKILLGSIGIVVTFYFGISKTQMENDRFFKELFRDFNLRYTALNECLYDITNSGKELEELSFKEKDKDFLSMDYIKSLDFKTTLYFVAAMIFYGFTIRTLGFIISTMIFLAIGFILLKEKNIKIHLLQIILLK